ncbi:MAG: DUF6454 family protein [Blastocatellales bacterium]
MKKYRPVLIFMLCFVQMAAGQMAAWQMAAGQMAAGQGPSGPEVSRRFSRLTRNSKWKPAESIRLNFNTHHPQGMVKVGDFFYLSSVEVTQPTRRYAQPQDGFDRDTGAGRGHLFKFDSKGELLEDLLLGEGSIYHPGGIDFDGRFIWVPVAEYRPDSRSIVYRVDPRTMKASEVFRYADHIGGIVHNTDNGTLHGVSWGSRFFYRWKLDRQGRVTNAATEPEKLRQPNRSFYIDYQDCKYLGRGEMLCSGLSNYRSGGARFSLGGLELVNLAAGRAIHQLPIELWTDSGLPMTQNPFWIEPAVNGLRAYFVPEDGQSTMHVFEVEADK